LGGSSGIVCYNSLGIPLEFGCL